MSSPVEEFDFEFERSATSEAEIEVGGAIDAFVSLEEIAPGATWNDALADAWGIPSGNTQKTGLRSLLSKLKLPRFNSVISTNLNR